MDSIVEPVELPMFPLGRPGLPGEVLPLRVFEPRYVDMLHTVLQRTEPHFGVVMIDRGSEVGGGDVRRSIGTKMSLARVEELPMGHFAVIAIGLERIRVRQWLEDDPFPRALVESFDDRVTDERESISSLRTNDVDLDSPARRIRHLLESDEFSHVPSELRLYSLAARLPIGPLDLQTLLEASSSFERENLLVEIVIHLEELSRFASPPDE